MPDSSGGVTYSGPIVPEVLVLTGTLTAIRPVYIQVGLLAMRGMRVVNQCNYSVQLTEQGQSPSSAFVLAAGASATITPNGVVFNGG